MNFPTNVDIHPSCIYCDNCECITFKKDYQIIQDEKGKQFNFCKDCIEEIDEQIEEEENYI